MITSHARTARDAGNPGHGHSKRSAKTGSAVTSCGWLPHFLLTIATLFASLASGATIQGGSLLLTTQNAQQIEAWVGEGSLTFTKVFASLPGDGKTAADFHFAANGLGRTIVAVEVPAQQGYERKLIGGYNP